MGTTIVSKSRRDEWIECEVYMKAIMAELGAGTPREALKIIREGKDEQA